MQPISEKIISLEKTALSRWGKGDPSGYLELSAEDVTYFDPFLEKRLDGLENLTRYYESIRGKIQIDKDEMTEPHVAVTGDMAVLTFNLVSYTGNTNMRWNCTEVYRKEAESWKIIQTHWSFTKPVS